jgi:AcrR family transcriptional regulator
LAAAKTLARQGISQLTMAALAEQLDVTPMTVYRHFSDKDALLQASLEVWGRQRRPSQPGRTAKADEPGRTGDS